MRKLSLYLVYMLFALNILQNIFFFFFIFDLYTKYNKIALRYIYNNLNIKDCITILI